MIETLLFFAAGYMIVGAGVWLLTDAMGDQGKFWKMLLAWPSVFWGGGWVYK